MNAPSLTVGSTLSGISSSANEAEKIVDILHSNGPLRDLLHTAQEETNAKKFKRNFYRLVVGFALDLGSEATDSVQRRASQFVRARANYIATSTTERLWPTQYMPTIHESPELEPLIWQEMPTEYEVVVDTNTDQALLLSDHDDRSEAAELQEIGSADIESFLVTSQAFANLLSRLQGFLIPTRSTPGPAPDPPPKTALDGTDPSDGILKDTGATVRLELDGSPPYRYQSPNSRSTSWWKLLVDDFLDVFGLSRTSAWTNRGRIAHGCRRVQWQCVRATVVTRCDR